MSQDTAVDLLAELLAFDTTSHRSNLPLIAFVEDWLIAALSGHEARQRLTEPRLPTGAP